MIRHPQVTFARTATHYGPLYTVGGFTIFHVDGAWGVFPRGCDVPLYESQDLDAALDFAGGRL